MAIIIAARGEHILVDDADFDELKRYCWHIDRGYASRSGGKKNRGSKIRMHRQITGLVFGDERCVDHINGNKLDNRRTNLRVCTKSQNGMNRGAQQNNGTGLKGAHWRKTDQKWFSQIQVDGKNHYLGRFDSAEEAHKAYCDAVVRFHGEFARAA